MHAPGTTDVSVDTLGKGKIIRSYIISNFFFSSVYVLESIGTLE